MSTSFRPAYPHGPLAEIFDDVFVVTGRIAMMPGMAIGRSMTVVRNHKRELTLINSVRLDHEGERELGKLGEVKHLVRLGWFHGADDPYYMSKYAPKFWSGERMVPVNVDAGARNDLVEGPSELGQVFCFRGGRYDEAALVLDKAGGVLVTCDSVQHNIDTRGSSLLGGLMLRAMGLVGGTKLGGPWLRQITRGKPEKMRDDFRRLTSLPFKHLIAGHGAPLREVAHEQVKAAVAARLGP